MSPCGLERVRQPCAQLTVIQNLPVEDEVSAPASASHRLLRSRDIDDRQAGMSESDITLDPDSGVVWPAMKQPRGHIGQQFAAHRFIVEPADSGYATHLRISQHRPHGRLPDSSLMSRHLLDADASDS